jgi:hypothetical protein
MLLACPENFSENGARPVQFLGPQGRLIGWARSFSDIMTVTDTTIVGGCLAGQLTRIAGRDVSTSDGHTVGKTFCRKALLAGQLPSSAARSARYASNHLPVRAWNQNQKIDFIGLRMHQFHYLQDGARETGLGHWLPGFLRSNMFNCPKSQTALMPQEK